MALVDGVGVGGEDLTAVLTGRVQEPVTVLAHDGDHRLADQSGQEPQGVGQLRTGDGDDLVETERTGEHGQSDEQSALVGAEQVEAPLERRPQRLLSAGCVPATVDEEGKAVRETLLDGARAERVRLCRGELDGQREPVERRADCRNVRCVGLGEHEVRTSSDGPFGEEDHRRRVHRFGGRRSVRRQGERRDRPHPLTAKAEGSPTRCEDPHVGARGQKLADEAGTTGAHVFAGVNDNQGCAVGKHLSERSHEVAPRLHGRSHRHRQGRRDGIVLVNAAEVDEPHVARRRLVPSHLGGQGRLPHATGAGERHES